MSGKYSALNIQAEEDEALIQLQPTVTAIPNRAFSAGSAAAAAEKQRMAAAHGGEDSPSYRVLSELLTSEYRLESARDLDVLSSNATRMQNLCSCLCCFCGVRTFDVKNGCVRLAEDGSGGFLIYGPGVHRVLNPFMKLASVDTKVTNDVIVHGDRTICTVKQGHVGYCEDRGQPVLLPPGLHEFRSSTLQYKMSVDLNNTLMKLGPYTVLTVDEGYSAITQNNGLQVILKGGETHLLTHRNWKFEKFMTEKIQTDDLQRIEATSADNVKMHTFATVVWRITDVQEAARNAADTMRHDGSDVLSAKQSDISKLRNDVLKQATASLASFIGEVRYSDTFHISSAVQNGTEGLEAGAAANVPPVPADISDYSPIWDTKRMASAVEKANVICRTYGVTILSINIISAVPADNALQNALAQGAVASAEAEMAETVARGQARAAQIQAEGDSIAEQIRAEGQYKAAELMASSSIAVELARMDKVAGVLDQKTSFFFGADVKDLGSMLSNPSVVNPRM